MGRISHFLFYSKLSRLSCDRGLVIKLQFQRREKNTINAGIMHITQQQEQFSNAYLKMVATLAECTLSKPEVDDDSIDFSIKTKNYIGVFSRPVLDIQLKCYRTAAINSEKFAYPLKIKNYNDLRITNVSDSN